MTHEEKFLTMLAQLAKLCRFELDPDLVTLYDESLSHLGYDRLCEALREIITTRSTRDPFPSIREISDRNAGAIPVADAAWELVMRIERAVEKYGYSDSYGAYQFMGDECWQAIGGSHASWQRFCSSEEKQGVVRAQLKNRLETILRQKSGSQMSSLPPEGEMHGKTLVIAPEDRDEWGFLETQKDRLALPSDTAGRPVERIDPELSRRLQLEAIKGEK